jgi:hypothetical protein
MTFPEIPEPDSSFIPDEFNTDYFSQPYLAMHRQLAGEIPVIDFTVLSMAVVTMSLLMIVAILRHQIDHLARGKEFFENVLEAAYHERKLNHLACRRYVKFSGSSSHTLTFQSFGNFHVSHTFSQRFQNTFNSLHTWNRGSGDFSSSSLLPGPKYQSRARIR